MTTPRPLLVTSDADLLDDLLRLAAAAGVEVDVAADPVAARARWAAAPLVLLGTDLASSTVIAQTPARLGVALVCRGSPEDDLDGGGVAGGSPTGVGSVLRLPAADDEIVERLAKSAVPSAPAGYVVGVLGGCGGAGASVLAAALGISAARRHQSVLLADLDPLGGGLDVLLGLEEIPGVRWADLAGVSGPLAPAALRDALPAIHGLAVLSFTPESDPELSPDAVCAVVDAGRQGGLVILDLPRQLSRSAAAASLVDELVLVVPADVRAAAAGAQVAAGLAGSARNAGVVVRRRAASTLTADGVAEAVSMPLLGQTRAEPGLAALLSNGRPLRVRRRGPLSTLCDQLLDQWRTSASERAA